MRFLLCMEEWVFSRTLEMGERSDKGLYDGPLMHFLFGFGIGMILAIFQISGIVLLRIERLYIFVRLFKAIAPICLRCCMFFKSC